MVAVEHLPALTLSGDVAARCVAGERRWLWSPHPTTYRGPIAIHAGPVPANTGDAVPSVPANCVVAVAWLHAVGRYETRTVLRGELPVDQTVWVDYAGARPDAVTAGGRWALLLSIARPLPEPVPAAGGDPWWSWRLPAGSCGSCGLPVRAHDAADGGRCSLLARVDEGVRLVPVATGGT